MTKQKKQKSGEKAKMPPAMSAKGKPSTKPLPAGAQLGLALLALYLMTLIIFPQNIFQHYDFNFGGDNLAAAPGAKMGEDFAREGRIPQWCPYILGGMPMVGSLLYANNYYPGFALAKLVVLLFFGSHHTWLFLHFLLAGLGVYLLLKEMQVHWIWAALCGLFFAFNPSMVVFADVGHGSKLMTIAYLPWILLLVHRLFSRPSPSRAAALALAFALQLLALHVQIAYYGAMMLGLYAVFAFATGGKEKMPANLKAALWLAAAMVVGFLIASPLYLQIQDYSHYSIRGGGATGGASWDYATTWSFHPLESLTYLFPSFYGFGGETYWGFMPFTDMPLYWGGAMLLFAPWALILKRNRMTIFLLVLAIVAWIVSFGKFLPLLYWPLFEFLPFFNKFRVPSLIQVLVLLPAVILAGVAFQAIWEGTTAKEGERANLIRKLTWVGGALAGFCLLLLVMQAALKPIFLAWMAQARPQMQGAAAQQSFALFTGDALRLLLLVGLLYGSAILALKQKWPRGIFIAAVALSAVLELSYFDRGLIHPTPPQQMQSYLQADDVVSFLQKQTEPFRVFPLTQERNPDWFMAHRIETILGYTGAKPRLYQEAIDSLGYNNFSLLRMLNTRYFISDKPIQHEAFQLVFAGKQEQVFQYRDALPRAFLVRRQVRIASLAEALQLYRSGSFDFGHIAALENSLTTPLDENATGTVAWANRAPDHFALEVNTTGRQLLVLSEPYYPSGWKATLDGREVPILKADYFFRGLEIPAGDHRVEMAFQPARAGLGNVFKWSGIILVALGLASSWLDKRKRSTGGV